MKNLTAKFIKCSACRRPFTQTIVGKKKSDADCPYCGKKHADIKQAEKINLVGK